MEHITFFLWLIDSFLLFAAIIIGFVLYFQKKIKLIKYFLFLTILVFLSSVLQMVGNYVFLNTKYKNFFPFYIAIELLRLSGLILIPLAAFSFIDKKFTKKYKIVLIILSTLYAMRYFLFFFLSSKNQILEMLFVVEQRNWVMKSVSLSNIVIYGAMIIFVSVLIIKQLSSFKSRSKKILGIVALIYLIQEFLLYDVLEYFYSYADDEITLPLIESVLFFAVMLGYVLRVQPKTQKILSFNDYNFTKREKEIIEYILAGYTNEQIMKKCYISLSTVKRHISNILQKTGLKNRLEIVLSLKNNSNLMKIEN